MIFRRVLLVFWPWALSLDEDIYNARDSCTSHATENIDYLTKSTITTKAFLISAIVIAKIVYSGFLASRTSEVALII